MGKERAFVVGGVCLLIGLAYFAGKRTNAESTARADVPPPSPPPPMTSISAERNPLDMSALDGLGARLAAEKANAGKSDPNASQVFAAIQGRLHIPLADAMQPVASVVGAQYCERMNTKHDVYVVVCEYSSEENATAGQTKATKSVVKRRDVLQKRASTCAVHQVGETKEAAEEAQRIKDLFRTL